MTQNEHGTELKRTIDENKRLLQENNDLLRKLHRYAWWGFWSKIFWIALLIGLPFALYFYVLEPYFTALGSSYETFNEGMLELPGLKRFIEAWEAYESGQG